MKPTRSYPRLHVDTAPSNALGQAGGMLLTETVHTSGIGHYLKQALATWKKPIAIHDPAKILTDIAITLALGGDALSDSSVLRDEPDLYGPVASNPTITRLIRALAGDADQALAAINTARSAARAQVWELAGAQAPNQGSDARSPMIIDIDATLVTAHSEKEHASPTYKKGFGFHPLLAFIDHGRSGCGEPAAGLLRPGRAGSNTAADHIELVKDVLAGLPGGKTRSGKSVLIRTDTAGGTHDFLNFLAKRRLSYSVGFMLPTPMPALYRQLKKLEAWEPAYDTGGQPRDGADVAELTGVLDLDDWPAGMRVIVRRERPHPGAQLRFDDVDGYRLTAFATNTTGGQLADLEVRHRSRARCEDRIRIAKDTGLQNFPLTGFDQNRVWLAIVALAGDLQAWSGMLAFADDEIAEEAAHAHLHRASHDRQNSPPNRGAYEEHRPLRSRHRRRPEPNTSPTRTRTGIAVLVSVSDRVEETTGGRSPRRTVATHGGHVIPEWQNQKRMRSTARESSARATP